MLTILTLCTPTIAQSAMQETAETQDCAICLSRLEEKPYLSPCGHVFDRACMQSWHKIKKSCPTCKTHISRPIAAAPHQRELDFLLIDAIENGCLFGVRRLLEQGANPNLPIGNAWPLLRACMSKHPQTNKIVAALIEHNAQINKKNYYGNTALHVACRHNSPNIALLELLIKAGADVNSANNDNETPLHYARHSSEAVALLLSHNAKVDACSNANRRHMKNRQRTVLLEICTQPGYTATERQNAANVASLLIAHGANIRARDEYGRSALQIAQSRYRDGRQVAQLVRNTLREQLTEN